MIIICILFSVNVWAIRYKFRLSSQSIPELATDNTECNALVLVKIIKSKNMKKNENVSAVRIHSETY